MLWCFATVYWPTSVFVCGFWYAPMDWEVSETGDIMSKCAQVEPRMKPSLSRCLETGLTTNGCPFVPPVKLHLFLSNERGQEQHLQSSSPPIFVGLSSIGRFVPNSFFLHRKVLFQDLFGWLSMQVCFFTCSMGFMKNPEGMLKVLKAVLEATNNRAVLLTAAYPPLDLAIITTFEHEITQYLLPQVNGKLWTSATILSSFVLLYPRQLYFMQSKGRQRVLSTCMLEEVDFYSNTFNYLYQGSVCWNFSAAGSKSNVSMLKGGVAVFNERLFCTSGYSAICQYFSKFVCCISDPFQWELKMAYCQIVYRRECSWWWTHYNTSLVSYIVRVMFMLCNFCT